MALLLLALPEVIPDVGNFILVKLGSDEKGGISTKSHYRHLRGNPMHGNGKKVQIVPRSEYHAPAYQGYNRQCHYQASTGQCQTSDYVRKTCHLECLAKHGRYKPAHLP